MLNLPKRLDMVWGEVQLSALSERRYLKIWHWRNYHYQWWAYSSSCCILDRFGRWRSIANLHPPEVTCTPKHWHLSALILTPTPLSPPWFDMQEETIWRRHDHPYFHNRHQMGQNWAHIYQHLGHILLVLFYQQISGGTIIRKMFKPMALITPGLRGFLGVLRSNFLSFRIPLSRMTTGGSLLLRVSLTSFCAHGFSPRINSAQI